MELFSGVGGPLEEYEELLVVADDESFRQAEFGKVLRGSDKRAFLVEGDALLVL